MIVELECVAHARRKFFDLHAANASPIAAQALEKIAELYAIEREGKNLDIEARRQLRQDQAQPKLDQLYDWLRAVRATAAEGGGLAKAIDYTLKRWPALKRYAQSGDLPIDNNPIENAIRPIAVGKNYVQLPIMRSSRLSRACSRARRGAYSGKRAAHNHKPSKKRRIRSEGRYRGCLVAGG